MRLVLMESKLEILHPRVRNQFGVSGRGYVKEALKAIITWGFREAQFNRIEAQVHPDNTASLALLEALGFLQEGRQREAGYWAGRHHDLLQYALLNRQWSAPNEV